MENGGNLFNSNCSRGQNGNNSNLSWDIWTSRFDWNQEDTTTTTATTAGAGAAATVTTPDAFMFGHQGGDNAHPDLQQQHQLPSLYAAGTSHGLHPDPHLTCLKLGKRHYFEDVTPLGDRQVPVGFPIGKRRPFTGGVGDTVGGGPPSSSSLSSSAVARYGSPAATVPRCQVEGCHMALLNAKDYHRRHKVCEMHSKAPKVVVLGIEQRFCQQCSRFHVVSEFDDSKRSCRRRLAGHNERRRKSSNDSVTRNPSLENKSTGGRFSCLSTSTGCALSLLSFKTASSDDLSSRSSAALRELIAENRAAVLAKQLFFDRGGWHQPSVDDMSNTQPGVLSHHAPHHQQVFPEPPPQWDRFHEAGAHVTLDLMEAPNSPFGFLSGRTKSKEEEEVCCEIWKSLEGTHVV